MIGEFSLAIYDKYHIMFFFHMFPVIQSMKNYHYYHENPFQNIIFWPNILIDYVKEKYT